MLFVLGRAPLAPTICTIGINTIAAPYDCRNTITPGKGHISLRCVRINGNVCSGGSEQDDIVLNPLGEIVKEEWLASCRVRKEIGLGEYAIMPNHLHSIVFIKNPGDGELLPAAQPGAFARTVGAMVAGFKAAVTRRINGIRNTPGMAVWQRNYYEHVIRDGEDYRRIAEYIARNPMSWHQDSYYADPQSDS